MTKDESKWKGRIGKGAQLLCSSSQEIIFCTFITPRYYKILSNDQMGCSGLALQLGPNTEDHEDGRISYFGSDPESQCGISLRSVEEKDLGEWK